jgi:hypothetical protein
LRFIFNLKFILNSNYFKMASVRVHFSPGFPEEQFAPAWFYETTGGEERLLRRVAQQNEAPPAEFSFSLEEDVPQRVALAVCGTPQRGEFPREQTVRFLLRRYSKYAEHHRKPVFLLRRYSIHAEHHVGVLLCGKSSSKRKSWAKVHPDGRHFEIIRV